MGHIKNRRRNDRGLTSLNMKKKKIVRMPFSYRSILLLFLEPFLGFNLKTVLKLIAHIEQWWALCSAIHCIRRCIAQQQQCMVYLVFLIIVLARVSTRTVSSEAIAHGIFTFFFLIVAWRLMRLFLFLNLFVCMQQWENIALNCRIVLLCYMNAWVNLYELWQTIC